MKKATTKPVKDEDAPWEPPIIEVQISDPDNKDEHGRTLWKTHELALTPKLMAALRQELAITPKKPDYKQMRLDAVNDLLGNLLQYTIPQRLKVSNEHHKGRRRTFDLNEGWVIHPDDWLKLNARLKQIDKMEATDE